MAYPGQAQQMQQPIVMGQPVQQHPGYGGYPGLAPQYTPVQPYAGQAQGQVYAYHAYPPQQAPPPQGMYTSPPHAARRGLDGGFDGPGGPAWSIKVGSCCFEIPVYLSYFLPILWVYYLVATVFNYMQHGDWLGYMLARTAFVYVLVLPLTILVHEMGHCLGALSVNTPVKQILLWPLGGLAYIGCTPSRCADIWVAFAGPLTHVPMFFAWHFAAAAAAPGDNYVAPRTLDDPVAWDDFWQTTFEHCRLLQIILAAFNLLMPAYPLDGGRILVNLLTFCLSPLHTAYVTIGVCIMSCIGLCIGSFFYYGGTQGVFAVIMPIAFIGFSCFQVYKCVQEGTIERHPLFNRGQNE